ncbi:MAG: O-antigen ligase family protein [Betaproteobacteria bacterium]|nr:O-antigen ligase family protein [Betaproteobacteria bacterium]
MSHSAPSPVSSALPWWRLAGPAFYLAVLPFSHVAALRSLGLGLTLLCGAAAWFGLRQQIRGLPPPPLRIAFALWLLAALASLPLALDPLYSLKALKGDFLYALILYGTLVLVCADARAFVFFRRVLGASLLAVSLLAIAARIRYGQWIVGYQNALGEYATIVVTLLPLLATAFFPRRIAGALTAGTRERVFLALGLLAASVATWLTLSRLVWPLIALIVMAFLLFAAIRRAIPRWTLALGVVAILCGTLVLAEHAAGERNTELTSLHGREMIYALAWKEFKQRPLSGVGYGREANRAVYRAAFPNNPELFHAHNVVLSWAEQMGVPGIVAILAIFLSLIWYFARLPGRCKAAGKDDDPDPPPGELVCVAGLILTAAVFLKNMSDMFFTNETLVLFFGVCGIFAGYGMRLCAPPFLANEGSE